MNAWILPLREMSCGWLFLILQVSQFSCSIVSDYLYPSSLSSIVTSSEAFSDPSILQVTTCSILEIYSTIAHSTCLYLILHHLFVVQSIIRSYSFATPWTVARQAPLSMGFPRQEYWSGLPFPSPGDLPDPGIKLVSSALAVEFFTVSHQGSPHHLFTWLLFLPL